VTPRSRVVDDIDDQFGGLAPDEPVPPEIRATTDVSHRGSSSAMRESRISVA
jgi:hypothetical protein